MYARSHESSIAQYLARELGVNRAVPFERYVFDVLGIERNLYTADPVANERDSITAKAPVEGTKLW